MSVTEASRRVMGTTASVIVNGGDLGAEEVVDILESLEDRWSRFRPGSELNRLNASAGEIAVISDETFHLVQHLVTAHALTGGRFDPTLGAQMVALGYDRTYRSLNDDRGTERASSLRVPLPSGLGSRITLFPGPSAVLLPAGIRLDPGGLGKGLAADVATRSAIESGATGVLVEIGGDIVTRGVAPGGGPWRIDVPATSGHPGRVVELTDGAVATSDTTVRTWWRGGVRQHHILDPSIGLPLEGHITATIVAGAGWWAEALATAAVVSTSRRDAWFDDFAGGHPEVTAFVTDQELTRA